MKMLKTQRRQEVVVLLHGLGRNPRSLRGAHLWLHCAGYRVLNVGYPSRRVGVQEAVTQWVQPALTRLMETHEPTQVHFVTHSLGGIVFRAWAAQRQPSFPLGRTVMMAPPNQGSEIIDQVRQSAFAKAMIGPVAGELGTSMDDLPRRLGPVPPGTGVIMGNLARMPLIGNYIEGPSDGVVTVEAAQVAGMEDFLLLPTDHTFIIWRIEALRAAAHFLKTGRFPRKDSLLTA